MFNVNGPEVLLLALLFLLLFGPERIPEVAMQIARWIGRFRAMTDEATADIRRELEAAYHEAEAARREFEALSQEARRTVDVLQDTELETRDSEGTGSKPASQGGEEDAGAGAARSDRDAGDERGAEDADAADPSDALDGEDRERADGNGEADGPRILPPELEGSHLAADPADYTEERYLRGLDEPEDDASDDEHRDGVQRDPDPRDADGSDAAPGSDRSEPVSP